MRTFFENEKEMRNQRKVLVFLILLFTAGAGVAQVNSNESPPMEGVERGRSKFVQLSFGMSNSLLRDFATSPLFYKGLIKEQRLAWEVVGSNREIELGAYYFSGKYKTTFNDHRATSHAYSGTFYHSQLFRIKRLSSGKLNFKTGGLIFATVNFRKNLSLQNNALGLESFHSLMGSAKISFDLSRTKLKEGRFLFFKYRLNPRKKTLSFRINAGLVNSFFRNGYAYINQGYITQRGLLLGGHQFHLFSGRAFSTALDYTWYLKNHNAMRLSYRWRAYTTNEKINKFEMAHHVLALAFLFNTNNK